VPVQIDVLLWLMFLLHLEVLFEHHNNFELYQQLNQYFFLIEIIRLQQHPKILLEFFELPKLINAVMKLKEKEGFDYI
jgi:hypothetical protein